MESVNPHGTRHHHANGSKEGSWKGMKKYLEQDMLCERLRGRVEYHFEVYSKFGSSSACFIVSLDGEVVKKFGFMFAIGQLIRQGQLGENEYLWNIPMNERDEYEDSEFSEALRAYRNQPISDSLFSSNPIQRMFAIVDRRVGKRTLQKLLDTVMDQPEWLQKLYLARLNVEEIR